MSETLDHYKQNMGLLCKLAIDTSIERGIYVPFE